MINNIKVYNRFYMNLIANSFASIPFKSWNLISIHASTEQPLFLDPEIALFKSLPIDQSLKNMQDKGCQYAISLCFDDVIPADLVSDGDRIHNDGDRRYKLFNETHGKKIIDFLEKTHSDIEPLTLVVHCHAGISRSGAVAYFASKKYNIDFLDDCIRPNEWVLSVLCKMSGTKIVF